MSAEFVALADVLAEIRHEAAEHEHGAAVAWGHYGACLARADRWRELAETEQRNSQIDMQAATALEAQAGDAIEVDEP